MQSNTPNRPMDDSLYYSSEDWEQRIRECDEMVTHYWEQNPDLRERIDEKKALQQTIAKLCEGFSLPPAPPLFPTAVTPPQDDKPAGEPNRLNKLKQPPLLQWNPVHELKNRIRAGHQQIRESVAAHQATIVRRTQAHNRKCPFQSIDEEQACRSDLLHDQINTWRKVLPDLMRRFAKIPDPRQPGCIEHSVTVLLMYGLFAFIFKLESRRAMNRELSSPLAFAHIQKLFPAIDSLPHACTLARFLERTDPKEIEALTVGLVRDLIRRKKFKKLLIKGCLPITIDGAQKLYRDGVLQDPRWCERSVGSPNNPHKQQYVYVIEANITFKNGLTIPLMSEFLYRDNNQLLDSEGKQDNEITAVERLASRLKQYFPRLKLMLFGDAMFATTGIIELLKANRWEFIIQFSKRRSTALAKKLDATKPDRFTVPGQPMYRRRQQQFYYTNDVNEGFSGDLMIHLVGCAEHYQEVNPLTGDIEDRYSERAWLSSVPITRDNVHELINLGARKKELIEDSINTMKNRGYHYQHAFSYDFNAMRGFHYLMRLGYAINALSEFSTVMKKYVKSLGCSATLKRIKETFFSPWLPLSWYEQQRQNVPRLCLQLE